MFLMAAPDDAESETPRPVYVQTVKAEAGATVFAVQDGDLYTHSTPQVRSFGVPPVDCSHLYGREAELDRLTRLAERSSGITILVYGPGGVGKTALAARFWSDYGADRVRLWLDATSPLTFSSSVLEVARAIIGYDLDYTGARDLVRSHLARNRGALVVLDNAPDAFASEELAVGTSDTVMLMTSRHAIDIPQSRYRIHIQPLDVASRLTWCRDLLSGSDAALAALAGRLSGFPLVAERLIDLFSGADYSADQGLVVLDKDPSLSDSRLFLGQSVRRQYASLQRADQPACHVLLVTALSGLGSLPSMALAEVFGDTQAVQMLGSLRLSGLTGANTSIALSVHDEVAASLRLLVSEEEKARAGENLIAKLWSQEPLEPSDPSHWRVLGARGELARRLTRLPATGEETLRRRADVLLSDLSYLRYRGLTARTTRPPASSRRWLPRNTPQQRSRTVSVLSTCAMTRKGYRPSWDGPRRPAMATWVAWMPARPSHRATGNSVTTRRRAERRA
jgi:hypothetical protein